MSPEREGEVGREAQGPGPGDALRPLCASCGRREVLDAARRRCRCGGLLFLDRPAALPGAAALRLRAPNLWRWREALPLPPGATPVSRGEGDVPLERADGPGGNLWLLREDRNPSGSVHDRGASVLVSALAALGVERLVVDSPGNGAIAVATYGAAAGLEVHAVVPDGLAGAKRDALLATGAEMRPVAGDTGARRARALAAARSEDAAYAGLAEDPFALHGYKTAAFHLVERLGHVPGRVVVPCGEGGLLLGLHRGFAEMRRLGATDRNPVLVGVRSTPSVPELEPGDAVVGSRAREAARSCGGDLVTVPALLVEAAQKQLWFEGRMVEAAAAAALAWYRREGGSPPGVGDDVLVLTGSGTRAGRPVESP